MTDLPPPLTRSELAERVTVTVRETAAVLGLSEKSAYAGAASGEIPTVRVGRRRLVPAAWLLGLGTHP